MLREALIKNSTGEKSGFVWRGGEVSRIEGFSDCVISFAITLVVISLEVPKKFEELTANLSGIVGFGLCFLLILSLWNQHYLFFRRYGLQDAPTILLNSLFLFLIVIYVFPLKFLFTLGTDSLIGKDVSDRITSAQWPQLMVYYGLGFAAVYLIFALMYRHAYLQRGQLELSLAERYITQEKLLDNILLAAVGVASIIIAVLGGESNAGVAGLAYPILIPLAYTVSGTIMGSRRRHAEQALAARAT